MKAETAPGIPGTREQALLSPAGLAIYDTNGKWQPYGYLRILNRALLGVAFGRTSRLLVNLPPRHGKSTLISRYFPPWFTGHFPWARVLLASYEGNFAASWGLKAMDVVKAHGRTLFNLRVRNDVCAASNWQYRGQEGGMSTAGVGGPFTGKGGNILIVDDPIKNDKEARSVARREEIWEWYKATALTRLEPGGAVILVQTRWHKDDLAGRVLKEHAHEGWMVLDFPALAREEGDDALGRQPGQALCPQRFDEEALAGIKAALGSFWFSALYQQSPTQEGGNIFKREWFRTGERWGDRIRRGIYLDTAHKEKTQNDYSAAVTLELTNQGCFGLDVWRDRVTYPKLKRILPNLVEAWGPDEIGIEDKDAGAMLIQELQRDTTLPVLALQADRDKVARAHAASPFIEAGRVYLPPEHRAPWVGPFLEEITDFPNGVNDDQADAFVHGINRLKLLGSNLWTLDQILVDHGHRSIAGELDGPR